MALFKSISGISSMWSQDMAIDLGTANTLVVLKEKGVVLNELNKLIIKIKKTAPEPMDLSGSKYIREKDGTI